MRNQSQKPNSIKEDILGAGFHILSGAGGDVKLLVQQAVQRLVGEGFVSRAEYDQLSQRVRQLEAAKPSKTQAVRAGRATAKPGRKTGAAAKLARAPKRRK
ncbi:MAG TPA: hypothetical protein PKW15_03170 [Alphaproteobacteria bacterium]|nr:hypothetical protein [Rhodospirillaceae bacterium]HRJ12226.1 hypothetical protein [Alphaproteobacteria bacterium]